MSRFVIFGASGDLTSRYLLPAVASLCQQGRLPRDFSILGLARHDWDTATFRRHIADHFERRQVSDRATREAVVRMLEYRHADVSDPAQIRAALGRLDAPIIAYLALPPFLFEPAIKTLGALGLPAESRLVVEKPFGKDLASAQALNRLLHQTFAERHVFRVDHFLHKQTVQNLLGLRFANRLFEPLWNAYHIERVEIVWDETLTVEGRAGYYDSAGALRDMIQNHLLQLLAFVAMEPPRTLHERDVRDRKADVLRAVRRLAPGEVAERTVRGRYRAGRIGDRAVPSYVDEPGIDASRGTETFAEISLAVENWRWAGVPFVLRSGKALKADRKEMVLHFRPVPHLAFGKGSDHASNRLRLDMDPDRVLLDVSINGPGDPFDLEEVQLGLTLTPQDVPAYGRLLLDLFDGDPTLSIRDDEAEESWRIVEPILTSWHAGEMPLHEYPAGSAGPQAAWSTRHRLPPAMPAGVKGHP